jgi:hypothetical protein
MTPKRLAILGAVLAALALVLPSAVGGPMCTTGLLVVLAAVAWGFRQGRRT